MNIFDFLGFDPQPSPQEYDADFPELASKFENFSMQSNQPVY